ncbi:hypothetical protein [Bradyrhizobium algeriense]|uniref:hypothetical protein n=1 Tax=Bradyrhizobium algeriense TaxID=634784 RepID=UPI000D36CE90|nr:hypothetical protein [Bradyrhizobium algeriense]
MRKLVLIAAFALASVSAQAAERIDRVPAGDDAPAVSATPVAAPPAAAPSATVDAAKPQAFRQQASRKQAFGKQASRSGATRRQTDEQKARQIAAQYGISW